MRVEIVKGLQRQTLEADRVTVYDIFDNPVSVSAVGPHPSVIFTSHVTDADFQMVLHNLGLDKTVYVDTLQSQELSKYDFR